MNYFFCKFVKLSEIAPVCTYNWRNVGKMFKYLIIAVGKQNIVLFAL